MRTATVQEAINGNNNDTVITPLRLKQVLSELDLSSGGGGSAGNETDPIFKSSPAAGITTSNIASWNAKQNALVSGQSIKTINGQDILGEGDITIESGSSSETPEVAIGSSTPTSGEKVWFQTIGNLYHNNNPTIEYALDANGNKVRPTSWTYWLISDYFEIKPNTDYVISGYQYNATYYNVWYDENKNVISTFLRGAYPSLGGKGYVTAKSPENAKYIRLTVHNGKGVAADDERNFLQLEEGTKPTAYKPYSDKQSINVLKGTVYEEFLNVDNLLTKDDNIIIEEKDPTVPAHVKAITQEDIDNWNKGTGGGSDYTLPIASKDTLGGIKVGSNLYIEDDGTLNAVGGGGGGTNASAETQEIMQIGVTSGFTLSISSAWQLLTVPFTTNKISIGNNLSLTPEGHIKIGPGISKISVRGNILTTSSALGLIDMRIYIIRDGQAINSGATYLGLDKAKSYRTVYIELPILEVQENDEICIKVTSEVSCSLTVADNAYLCVEKINETNAISGGETSSAITICNQSSNLSVTVDASWTPYEIPLPQLSTNMGDAFTHENGAIKVNRDCTALVSSSTLVKFVADKIINVMIYVIRNGSRLLISNGYIITANWQTVSISPVVYDFLKGDIIQMYIECGATGTLGVGNGKGAQITVQKINETNVISGGGTGGSGVSIDQIYPVGSIYISASATVDPNVVFTGTQWERFANGKTLIGVDEEDADFATVGLEGGSKDAIVVKHSHSVTGEAASAGAHTHTVKGTSAKTSGTPDGLCETWDNKTQDRNGFTSSNGAHTHTVTGTADEVGEDGTGKNLQPFITVFMWQRVA